LPKARVPTELQEQIALAAWLTRRGVWFCHPPNEGRRSRAQGARLKAAGMQSGVPDILIFDRPPTDPEASGTAIELKRVNGRPSQVSDNQRKWLEALELRGWKVRVAYGCDDACKWLLELGY
jgi:hypothetical protein